MCWCAGEKMAIFKKSIKELEKKAREVKNLQASFGSLSDAELKEMFFGVRKNFENGSISEDELMVSVFAIVCEVGKRVLDKDPYEVQVMGAVCLNGGDVASMATGEGKTLTSTMPAVLNAITQGSVHIATANEYLARRDFEEMSRVYEFLGLKTGLVYSGQSLDEKKKAYACDITYGTGSEFGFDYLRDNRAKSESEKTGQRHGFALVDEVDAILIDEATIPMVLSESTRVGSELFEIADEFVRTLSTEDYEIDKKRNSISLTDAGLDKVEKALLTSFDDDRRSQILFCVDNALKAHHLFHEGIDYLVQDGKIVLIDRNTGRLMHGREYSDFLGQSIQIKEGVPFISPSVTVATISYPKYYTKYKKIGGMTGTAVQAEDEFLSNYNMFVYEIPTNKPVQRIDEPMQVYLTKDAKLQAILREVQRAQKTGQPILIGTNTVEESQELALLLKRNRIPCSVLNANTKHEAEIISCAGMFGSVTIATNMAGRGTDIKLGGNPETLTLANLRENGIELSLEEQNIVFANKFASENERLIYARQVYEKAQKTCRLAREKVVEVGGLRVVSTTLAESERVTKQLLGRSGRQGDVGSSVEIISLEDRLLSTFVSDALISNHDRFEKTADENGLIHDKFAETLARKAQTIVSDMNLSSRNLTVKFENYIHPIREVVYESRNQILQMKDANEAIENYIVQILENKVSNKNLKAEELNAYLQELFGKYSPSVKAEDMADSLGLVSKLTRKIMREKESFLQSMTGSKETAVLSARIYDSEKSIIIDNIDKHFTDFLNSLEDVKIGSILQSFANVDPYQEYLFRISNAYKDMVAAAQIETIKQIFGQMEQAEKLKVASEKGKI